MCRICPVHSERNFVLPERQTASQVRYVVALCKMHVHVLSSEAEHSEAEPAAILSMSGHMVGILVQ